MRYLFNFIFAKNNKKIKLTYSIRDYSLAIFLVSIGIYIGQFYSNNWLVSNNDEAIINVCFVPSHQNCTDLIVNEINKAKTSIIVQAYSFTSKPIAESLVEAKNRNIDVKVLCDKSQFTDKYSKIPMLIENGILVEADYIQGISHNKIIIIDNQKVITGSFNFTFSAQNRNAENIVMINDPLTVKLYKNNFDARAGHKFSSYLK